MTPAQDRLFRQVLGVLDEDPRVLGVWLSGSFARDAGDEWSDIDLVAEVAPADQAACVSEYRQGRPGMPEAVNTLVAYQVVISAVTADWQRYDITFITRPQMAALGATKLKPLSGTAHDTPPAAAAPADSGAAGRVEGTVREFLRVMGLAPVACGRGEWLVMQHGAELLRHMVVDVMLEANGVPPGARGAKTLNRFLTAEQRATLEALVPAAADRDAVLAETVSLWRLFQAHARPLAARVGAAWPDDFEEATRRHLKATLSLDL